MKDLIDVKTLLTALLLSFFVWSLSKIYLFFDDKIRSIDTIEGLKKQIEDLRKEFTELKKLVNEKINNE